MHAVERADIVIVMIDASEGVTEQDAKIAGIAHERGKGVIIAVNKWDAIEKNDKTIYKHTNRIREVLAYMPYAELVFISAKTGLRISRMFETIDAVIENQTLRIQTGVLNEILSEAVAMQQPPSDKGKRLKIYYMTQVAVKPPTFVIFVNDKELMHFSYTRYLENKIRDAFGFAGTSLVVLDGTGGQNALAQARQFAEVANVSGIILTKLDGTAKGGIAVAIQSELDIPVKYIGVGESIDDLQKFDADAFVNALFDVDHKENPDAQD